MDYYVLQIMSFILVALLALITTIPKYKNEATGKWKKGVIAVTIVIVLICLVNIYSNLKKQTDENEKNLNDLYNKKIEKNMQDSLRRIDDSVKSKQLNQLSINLKKSDDILSNSKLSYEKLINLNSSSQLINNNLTNSIITQQNLLEDQQWVQNQILRLAYPLQPLTLHYILEYSFSEQYLTDYADTLEQRIIEIYNKNNKTKLTNLKGFEDINLIYRFPELLPTQREPILRDALLSNNVSIICKTKDSLVIEFIPGALKGQITTIPYENLELELYVNFARRRFIKKMIYAKPVKVGNDNLAIGSIDLVGRTIEINHYDLQAAELLMIGFQFQYDRRENFNRYITFTDGYHNSLFERTVKINEEHIGIDKITKAITR